MSNSAFKRIGLTGGIGSGKSTLGQMLQSRGYPLIDADAISHALTAPHGSAIEPIRHTFGAQYITADGALDRTRMRQLVFNDATAKQRLQALLHPLILSGIEEAEISLNHKGNSLVVIDIPLLVESSHWRARLHRIIVVDCDEDTQIARVMQRNKMSAAEVQQIMAQQTNRSKRLAAADIVIFNNTDRMEDLRTRAQAIDLLN
jgi:dephospho-CoA kinase